MLSPAWLLLPLILPSGPCFHINRVSMHTKHVPQLPNHKQSTSVPPHMPHTAVSRKLAGSPRLCLAGLHLPLKPRSADETSSAVTQHNKQANCRRDATIALLMVCLGPASRLHAAMLSWLCSLTAPDLRPLITSSVTSRGGNVNSSSSIMGAAAALCATAQLL